MSQLSLILPKKCRALNITRISMHTVMPYIKLYFDITMQYSAVTIIHSKYNKLYGG